MSAHVPVGDVLAGVFDIDVTYTFLGGIVSALIYVRLNLADLSWSFVTSTIVIGNLEASCDIELLLHRQISNQSRYVPREELCPPVCSRR